MKAAFGPVLGNPGTMREDFAGYVSMTTAHLNLNSLLRDIDVCLFIYLFIVFDMS